MLLCAALLIENKETGMQEILPCRRHGDGINFMYSTSLNAKWKVKTEGFIDTENNFYDREEALGHARLCNQLSATTIVYKQEHLETRELYSEDLY